MASKSSITVHSLGEIVQRAPAVAAKTWCLYVFFCNFVILSRSEAGALFVRGWHTLNRCCVAVYGSILMLFTPFSSLITISKALGTTYFCC